MLAAKRHWRKDGGGLANREGVAPACVDVCRDEILVTVDFEMEGMGWVVDKPGQDQNTGKERTEETLTTFLHLQYVRAGSR